MATTDAIDVMQHPAFDYLKRGELQLTWANTYLAAGKDPEYTDDESISAMFRELEQFLLREIRYRTYFAYPDMQRLAERGQMPPTDDEIVRALGRYAAYSDYLAGKEAANPDETDEESLVKNWYANYD